MMWGSVYKWKMTNFVEVPKEKLNYYLGMDGVIFFNHSPHVQAQFTKS